MPLPQNSFNDIALPLIKPDPSYLLHMVATGEGAPPIYNGPLLNDLNKFGLITTGKPTGVPKSPTAEYPAYFVTAAGNFVSTALGLDTLDSTGDRFGAIVFVAPAAIASTQSLYSNGTLATSGNMATLTTTTGTFNFISCVPGTQTVTTTNAINFNQVNVACFWRTGNNIYAQLNLGPVAVTAAGAAETIGSSVTFKVGLDSAGAQVFTGGMCEIVQGLGTPPGGLSPVGGANTWSTRVQQAVLDKVGLANAWNRS